RLRSQWRSPVYGLYDKKVIIGYEGDRKYHYFRCANRKCKLGKNGKAGGVRRYLDSKDRSATGNLINHAKACRGTDTVTNIMGPDAKKAKGARDGSIYAAFARLGQRVRSFSHRPFTSQETRYDDIFTGRPMTTLPSPSQIGRDIRNSFKICKKRMANLLQEHPGDLNFSTDAWTSPNHRAMIAWVVHLQHEGKPLSFLLDVKELPESHTGEALARAF
ncbi:hypothetical protein B0H11DRAFT_1641641, partial [Mycena galericulata]